MAKKKLKNRVKGSGKWKGGKRPTYKYEGTQYTGGRKKGQKNLKRTDDGNLINQHGVVFTPEEKRALERRVNAANNKRMKMLKAEAELERKKGGKNTGQKVSTLQAMGKESDFIISRRSKSLQRFKSKEDYEKYMQQLDIVNRKDYIDEKTRLYKRNHMQAIKNVFGKEAKDVLMKIRMMKPEDYRKLIQSDEDMEVSYVYDPSARTGKLNAIRRSLNMTEKEYDINDEFMEV